MATGVTAHGSGAPPPAPLELAEDDTLALEALDAAAEPLTEEDSAAAALDEPGEETPDIIVPPVPASLVAAADA